MNKALTETRPVLTDRFGRQVTYLRLSVTDRCDFRCVYCMAEDMTFLPRADILSLEEILLVARVFVRLGVRKIRITGGEPLIRNNILWLFEQLGALDGLDELVLTSNGSQLSQMAPALKRAGVKRINISLDSLRPERFTRLTRTGKLSRVLAGIDAARAQGFAAIKLNSVILKGRNDDEILDLVDFARRQEVDISFIEEMPLGEIVEHNRALSFMPSDVIRDHIARVYSLQELHGHNQQTALQGGPSRYYGMQDSRSKIGFISPHSHNFCASCNRVRLTAEGRLLLCLGNEHSMDLRAITRQHPGSEAALEQAIREAIEIKPERHHFELDDSPQILRFMNMTGG